MALDARRMILAAVEAAIDDVGKAAPTPTPKRKRRRSRLPAGPAILIGAGAVTAVRLASSGPRIREALESVEERLADYVQDGAGS